MGRGFGEEEMDVLGHEDVGVQREVVGAAGSFDDLFEGVFNFGCFEVWKTTVATEGDEVKLACVVTSFEAFGHEGFYRLGEEDGSRLARMPTHAVRLHEWGTRSMGWGLCIGHSPTRLNLAQPLH